MVLKLPTNEEAKIAKAHLKKVDFAQEMLLDEMFEDLRINYESNLPKKEEPDK